LASLSRLFVDRQQAFSSHLQDVEAGSAGREFKVKPYVSTGFKDFHIVIITTATGAYFRQEDAIGLFV